MAKINRNTPCPCGSGKKYKKCCLSNKVDQAQEEKANRLAFMEKFRNQHKDKEITWARAEGADPIKISEVIWDFADELLSRAHTKKMKETAIATAICAWNLAFIEENKHASKIENFMHTMHIEKGSQEWDDISQLFQAFIYKKETKYPSINRFILSFELNETTNGLHLNIISSEVLNNQTSSQGDYL